MPQKQFILAQGTQLLDISRLRKHFPSHVLLPVAMVFSQICTIIGLWIMSVFAYNQNTNLPESLLVPLTNFILGVGGGCGCFLGIASVCLLIIRTKWWISAPVIVLLCVPSIICACIFTYGFLIFICVV